MSLKRRGVSSLASSPATTQTTRAVRAWVRDRKVWIELEDGRGVGFPAANYWRLREAGDDALSKVRIEARGRTLRWEELDEDLTVGGILAGRWRP